MVLDNYGLSGLAIASFVSLLWIVSLIASIVAQRQSYRVLFKEIYLLCSRWLGFAWVVLLPLFIPVFGDWRLICVVGLSAFFVRLVIAYLPPIIPVDFRSWRLRRPELTLRHLRYRGTEDKSALVRLSIRNNVVAVDQCNAGLRCY